MMNKLIIFSCCLLFVQLTAAQKVSNQKIQTSGDSIVLSFDIQGKVGPFKRITVTPKPFVRGIEVSEDSRVHLLAFSEELQEERKVLSRGKQISWQFFEDLSVFPGKDQLTFQFELNKERLPSPVSWVLSYAASTNAPVGFTLQRLSNWGGYVSGKFWNPGIKTVGTIGNSGEIPDTSFYSINQKQKIKSFTISGGVTKRFGVRNHIYIGGGYGLKQLLWKVEYLQDPENLSSITKEEWRINENRDYSGIVGEAGVFWRFGNVVLDTGVGTIAGKEFYANLGIGYVFARSVPKPK